MIIINKGADYSALGLGRAFIPEDQISNEVKSIMAHYAGSDIVKMSALQEFFDSIGSTIKGKLRNMILPLFASSVDEAIYDIIQGIPYNNRVGNNPLSFNSQYKNVAPATTPASPWQSMYYYITDPSVESNYGGRIAVMSLTDNLVTSELDMSVIGTSISINDCAVHEGKPNTTNNKKIIGLGVVSADDTTNIIRLADTSEGDKLTPSPTQPSWYNRTNVLFGKRKPSNPENGVRILVTSDQLLTSAEAQTLRDAVKALDDKIWGK